MKNLLIRALMRTAICLTLIVKVYSQETGIMLTGHLKTSESVIHESKEIVVATFTSLGFPGSDASGSDFYEQAEIQVVSVLQGSISGKTKVGYSVWSVPGKNHETPPMLGTQYIMFIQKLGPQEYEIKKLLPATNQNILKVKQIIASR